LKTKTQSDEHVMQLKYFCSHPMSSSSTVALVSWIVSFVLGTSLYPVCYTGCRLCFLYPLWCGSLSPRHDASSGCGWRKRPSDTMVAANILNKQSRTTDTGCSSSLWLGEELSAPHCKETASYEMLHGASEFDGSFETE